jgi:hypothetical protein
MHRQKERFAFQQRSADFVKRFGAVPLMAASLVLAWAEGAHKPDGREVLMRMADFLAKSPTWSVSVLSSYDAVQPDGYKVEWNETRKVTVSRPDRLRIESQRSDGARTLVLFDGKNITTSDEGRHVFAQMPHPGSLDDAIVYFVHNLGMRLPLAVMLLSRMPEELNQRVEFVKYVEKTATLGTPADHIAAKTPTVDFQVWIAEGDRPLPVRVVLTYKNAPGQPQFRAQFSDWDLDTKPLASLFTFTPPDGSKKIPFAASLSNILPSRRGSASRMKGGNQ